MCEFRPATHTYRFGSFKNFYLDLNFVFNIVTSFNEGHCDKGVIFALLLVTDVDTISKGTWLGQLLPLW